MVVNPDFDYFDNLIIEKFGSHRKFAPHIISRVGKPLDHAQLSRLLRGERDMTIREAKQLADLLDVPILDVLFHAGVEVSGARKSPKK